jgi:serine/threonine protein kinase
MSRPGYIGQTIAGRYRIDEILGQGGMSAVYKAFDPNLKRVVAVKLIHPHLASDPRFLVRFEEEASAVAQLRHPHIVQVYDFNHDGDLYYMVQEFVAGETLQLRLRRLNQTGRRMPVDEAVKYIAQIAAAAGYAHQRGMVHRDIKPANIMLDVQGQAILMDFGIVKIVGGTQHTATGAVVGTAQYLPPELIRGETPDARSDIYSLGVTLFEMVSGRPPFEADSAMTLMMMHLNDPVPDLRQLRPEVPDELIAVIEKALQKDRGRRYASMEEFAAALQGSGARPRAGTSQAATRLEPAPGSKADPGKTMWAAPANPVDSSSTLKIPPAGRAASSREAASPAATGLSPASSAGAERQLGEAARPASGSQPAIPARPGGKGIPPLVLIGGGLLALLLIGGALVVGGIVFLPRLLNAGGGGGQGTTTSLPGAGQATPPATLAAALLPADNGTPTPTLEPSATFTPAPTAIPTDTPTPTLVPTPTIPIGVPFARINGITLDNQGRYVVEYETFEYTEALPGVHVHFFFDTVPPEAAGRPGGGPWFLYGGPRPFTGYRPSDRPRNAAQMCALVANPDHSVQLDSGSCAILPDVTAAFIVREAACRAGPAPEYPALAPLEVRQVLLVRGISPDESWWVVANPQDREESCWIFTGDATISGDISTLPLVEPPPLPTGAAGADLFVEITGITIDGEGRYVVEYVTRGFAPQLPGTHIHFFFNNVSPDQVGMDGGGNRRMHGGSSPFTGYLTTDRPAEASEMCALVANPNHSVIPESGNCVPLPGG